MPMLAHMNLNGFCTEVAECPDKLWEKALVTSSAEPCEGFPLLFECTLEPHVNTHPEILRGVNGWAALKKQEEVKWSFT